MKISQLGKALIIFFASYAILLILFSQFGPYYFKPFAGIFRWEIDSFYPYFKVSSLHTENYQGQQMISLDLKLTQNTILKDGTVLHTIGRPYNAKTISIDQYLHPIIILSILAAWPGIALRDRFKVFLLALPFLLVVEMVDIPILLATRCDELMRAKLLQDPEAGRSLGSYWVSFMHTGGRSALSILAIGLAFGCFYLGRFLRDQKTGTSAAAAVKTEPSRAKVGRNEPCPCGSGKKFKNCCDSR